jgi:hypothetical protein
MTFLIPSDIEWEVWMRFHCIREVVMSYFLLTAILDKLFLLLASPNVRRVHLVIKEESAPRPPLFLGEINCFVLVHLFDGTY